MDSSQCSLILVADSNTTTHQQLQLLEATFAQVRTTTSPFEALQSIRSNQTTNHHPTILLLDLDQPSTSLESLRQTVKCIQKESIDAVPVVCCRDDSPAFMLQCLDYGAADYILKPLCADVIKTMFLNIHRYQANKNNVNHHHNTKQTSPEFSNEKLWPALQDRLKTTFVKETWLSEMMVQNYTPGQNFIAPSNFNISSEHESYLKKKLCSWNFLPLDLTEQDLIHCVYLIFEQVLALPELHHLVLTRDQLYNFIQDICNSYHKTNPYHNFKHAVDVLQSSYYFLCKIGALEPMANNFVRPAAGRRRNATWRIDQLLRPKDIFALLIASIGHDVGHPGVNNMFMINTSNPLALLYNDRSVLESFHSMALFQIISKHKFVSETNGSEYQDFRKTVVHSILATDMGLHGEYVAKINDQLERLRTKGLDMTDEAACDQERLLICGALIKCADIGNCTRPFMEAKRWAVSLVDEFSNQGDLERELGLPVLPVNDRGKIGLEDFQLGFIRHVAINLFQAVANVIPEMSYCLDYMQQNVKVWEARKSEGHDSGVGDSQSEKDDLDLLSHIPTIEESVEDDDDEQSTDACQSSCRRSSIHTSGPSHSMYSDTPNTNGRLIITSPKQYPTYKHINEHDRSYTPDAVRGYKLTDRHSMSDEDKLSLPPAHHDNTLFSRMRRRRARDASCRCSIQ